MGRTGKTDNKAAARGPKKKRCMQCGKMQTQDRTVWREASVGRAAEAFFFRSCREADPTVVCTHLNG